MKGFDWHVYYHKMCLLRLIRLLKDSVNTDSVLVEKVTLHCHYGGKCWNKKLTETCRTNYTWIY